MSFFLHHLLIAFPSARPIFTTVEHFCGLTSQDIPETPGLIGISGFSRGLLKVALRVFLIVIIMIIAIAFPSFDRVMAFMGSAFCFTICVVSISRVALITGFSIFIESSKLIIN